ncbi:hypothetical protein ACF0H5_011650 [Mactra antiquata]
MTFTRSGKECQRWDSQTPHSHELIGGDFPEATLSDAENYCRDPTASGYTWCYTTDPDTRWEPCDVSTCTKYRNDQICYNDIENPNQYKGRWDLTVNNLKCQRWDSQTPHSHNFTADSLPDDSLKEASNYCRLTEDNDFRPIRCLTTDPNYVTKYCEITKCKLLLL